MTHAPHRFYTSVSVSDGPPFGIFLDNRPIKTPAKAALALPTRALADAVAAEWERQGDTLDLAGMSLTRLANVAIDRTPSTRAELAQEVARYAETDLLCHLADSPADLRAAQDKAWSPLRAWVGKTLGIVLVPVEGVIASAQPAASLKAAEKHAEGLDDFRLTGLAHGCGLFGSAILALALEQGQLSADEALAVSRVDEIWQIAHWGEDAEARKALDNLSRDVSTLGTWFQAL